MEVIVRDFITNGVKYDETRLVVNQSVSLKEGLKSFMEKLKIKDENSIVVSYKTEIGGITVIDDLSKSLNDLKWEPSTYRLIIEPRSKHSSGFSLHLVINLAYFLPIPIIIALYILLSARTITQTVACICSIIHFLKRLIESNTVNEYKQNGNVDCLTFIGMMIYYPFLSGAVMHYYIFTEVREFNILSVMCTAGLVISEYGNYTCHQILMNTKKINKGNRGIPRGNLYEYVSCGHYTWEILTWLFFFGITRSLVSFLFLVFSVISMSFLAYGKHANYIKFFGDDYPKNRKRIIPFIF